jgi:hypothetical protein
MGLFDIFRKIPEPPTDALVKARAKPKPPAPSAYDFDPQDFFSAFYSTDVGEHWHEGTIGLDFQTLRRMARVPLISAIINTRVNQVAEFSRPQLSPFTLGYKIALRDHDKEPSESQQKRIKTLDRWLQTCGDDRIAFDNTFENFLRKIVRDAMIFDQCCFEVVRSRGGKIAGFVAVDAATIRRAKPTDKEKDKGRRDPAKTAYVQILKGKIRAEFTQQELCFGVRRPRTWMKTGGYGFPELEELARTITNLINAETYNANNFTHGMHSSGILAIKSKMNPQLFRAFRREFYSMLSGVDNAKKTPIIQLDPEAKEEIQSVSLSNTNREMEYSQWMSWLLRIACSVFAISPTELGGNWQYGNEGQTNSLTSGSPGDRITTSKELGLRPLLRSVESWLNRYVIQVMEPDLEIRFEGFDSISEQQKLDNDIKSLRAFRTVNEVRALYDLDPIDNPIADMVLDPTYVNAAQQAEMMAQQQEEGGEGEEGEEGEEGMDWSSLFAEEGGEEGEEGGEEGKEPDLGKIAASLKTLKLEIL